MSLTYKRSLVEWIRNNYQDYDSVDALCIAIETAPIECQEVTPDLTADQIIEIRKRTHGDSSRAWGDTLAFARAVLEGQKALQAVPGIFSYHDVYFSVGAQARQRLFDSSFSYQITITRIGGVELWHGDDDGKLELVAGEFHSIPLRIHVGGVTFGSNPNQEGEDGNN